MAEDALKPSAGGRGLEQVLAELSQLSFTAQAEQAVPLLREAVTLSDRQARPKQWAALQGKLGQALANFWGGDVSANREEAIRCCNNALSALDRAGDAVLWAMAHFQLGELHAQRLAGNALENREQALEHYREALSACDAPELQWLRPVVRVALAKPLLYRETPDHAACVERAIEHLEAAVREISPAESPSEWAEAQMFLGGAYRERWRGDRSDNIERACGAFTSAMKVFTRESDPSVWAGLQNMLGATWLQRLATDYRQNPEEALACHRRAQEVLSRETDPLGWAETETQCGDALQARFLGDPEENLDQALACYRRALEIRTLERDPNGYALIQANLAGALTRRRRGDPGKNLREAIVCLEATLRVFVRDTYPERWADAHANLGAVYGSLVRRGEKEALHDVEAHCRLALEVYAPGTCAQERRRILGVLGDAHFDAGGWGGAVRAYTDAVAEGETLFAAAHTPAGRQAEVWHLAPLCTNLAYALLRAGRCDEALLRLEQGKMRNLTREGAQRGAPVPSLAVIPADGAAVLPILTEQGSAVLVIPGGAATVVPAHVLWLDDLKREEALRVLRGNPDAGELGGWLRSYLSRSSDPPGWAVAVAGIGVALWNLFLGAVHGRLQALGLREGAPVVFAPQAGLGVLPWHAAAYEKAGLRRYFLDDFTVSYTPSLTGLEAARQRLHEVEQRPGDTLLAVANPTGDLEHAGLEAWAIAERFDASRRRILSGGEATQGAVLEALALASHIHFSCHARYDWNDAFLSGLRLADGRTLTLNEILANIRFSGARLVTLSACETGLTRATSAPDEQVGLTSAILQAGAPAVAATLWPVSDASTAMVMAHFYECHRRDGLTPAAALRRSQLWLRDATAQDLADLCEGWRKQPGPHRETASTVWRRFARLEPGVKPYAHPKYWAPFVLTGL